MNYRYWYWMAALNAAFALAIITITGDVKSGWINAIMSAIFVGIAGFTGAYRAEEETGRNEN